MSRYILRRLVLIMPLLLGITVINYTIFALAPGDPISAMIDPMQMQSMSAEDIEAIREALGLSKPIPVRYLLWLREVLRGNLGYSIWFNTPVGKVMIGKIGNSLPVMALAIFISTAGGILLGIISALKPYSAVDYGLTAFAFAGVAMPGFFFALLLIYVLSLRLGWFPPGGITTPGAPPSVSDRLVHMILPASALAYTGLGSLLRYTRSSMLEVMHQEYMTTARAKGLAEGTVVARHAFRNALLPVITIVGMRLPGLFGGSVLIETVFNYPGVGHTMVFATGMRDYPLLMGGVLLTSVLVLFSNLLADLAYGWADPRIRFD